MNSPHLTIDCEFHGTQRGVERHWFIAKSHPKYEQLKAEGRESIKVIECSVCEEEIDRKVADVLASIKTGEVEVHAPHSGTCDEAHGKSSEEEE